MESLQVASVILFIFGILTASSMLRDGKGALAGEHLAEAQRIERMTVLNALGPLLPLIAALGIVSLWQHHAVGIGVAATLLTTALLALRGVVHARRMRGAGVPETYSASYRNAHAIRATSLALCALALISAV
jgi:hypothetical protein